MGAAPRTTRLIFDFSFGPSLSRSPALPLLKFLPTKKPLTETSGAFGDPAGIRTQDPYIKSVLLYQLSYRISSGKPNKAIPFLWAQKYGDLSDYATPAQKKGSWPFPWALLAGFMLLPFWCLAADGPGQKKPAAPAGADATALRRADSLLAAGRFAAAAPVLRRQVWQRRQASARVLLQLAYAQQQLGHYPAALLYLAMAQARQPRLDTWRQQVALAARYRLVGYPATWQQELRVRAQRYYYPGLQALLGGAVLGALGLGWYRRRVRPGAWLAYAGFVGLAGAYLLVLPPAPVGLVARPGAVLMAGPGAGAAWLSTAAAGDRLLVLGRQDIWLQVRWQQRDAYIRAADVFVVE